MVVNVEEMALDDNRYTSQVSRNRNWQHGRHVYHTLDWRYKSSFKHGISTYWNYRGINYTVFTSKEDKKVTMELIIICIAVTIHYISDYMSKNPEYKCPEYCEVDHEHLPIEKEESDVSKSSNRNTKRKQTRNL